jgi:glyoxylase-like metal-dependent hydrolase (beta-lactamase superfamily II)
MMRIAAGLHLVMSGGLGFDLTDPFDCNVFMLDSGDGYVLFDSGVGRDLSLLRGVLRDDGVDPARIGTLILTHAHGDHAGGAAALKREFGLRVIAGSATAKLVSAGDEEGISLKVARQAGIYPEDYRFAPCPIDRTLDDSETLHIGDLRITAVAAPGHSADHQCYLVVSPRRRVLVAGDAVFFGGRVALQDIWDCDVSATARTIRRIAALDYDTFLPGHGVFSLSRGRRHAEAALDYVNRLIMPPSLFG